MKQFSQADLRLNDKSNTSRSGNSRRRRAMLRLMRSKFALKDAGIGNPGWVTKAVSVNYSSRFFLLTRKLQITSRHSRASAIRK